MTEKIAGKIIEAYKSNPILTGLLLINVGMFIGFGWYIMKLNAGTGVYVTKLHEDLVSLAIKCGDK